MVITICIALPRDIRRQLPFNLARGGNMTRNTERLAILMAVMTMAGCGSAKPVPAAPTPGYLDQQIDLGGRNAHIWCYGQGSPTVI